MPHAGLHDFEGYSNGTVVTNQYSGVKISALNSHLNPDHAVVFDPSPKILDTYKVIYGFNSDLMVDQTAFGSGANFSTNSGSLTNGFDPDKFLNLKDNSAGCPNQSSLDCSRPDDQAGNAFSPAGVNTFAIDQSSNIHRFDHSEVKNTENNDEAGSKIIDNLVYSAVSVPASAWIFGTALIGFIGLSRRTSV